MDGFFITVNCSQILSDSNESSYKIFIDTTKMSIVYELKEWIRFMFNLENCFFLIHDNSVIHELEDIKVLEILKHLETKPCLQLNCIHRRIERNLLNKLNLFIYWNEVKVHKLFVARQNVTQKVSHNLQHCSNANEKSSTFLLESHRNTFVQLDKSKVANNEHVTSSPSEYIYNMKIATENNKVNSTKKNQLDLKEINTSVSDKESNLDDIKTLRNFFNRSKSSSPHFESNGNVTLYAESTDLTSPITKKQKIQSEPKKHFSKRRNPKGEIPFSIGALLSDIREKAENYELKEKQGTDKKEQSFNSVCLNGEKEEKNTTAEIDCVDNNCDDSGKKRRRRRKHKKQNLKVDINLPFPDKTWNCEESSFSTKPNHIRFSDTDEVMETEATDNTFDGRSEDCNSFKVLNNETQMTTCQLTPELTPLIEENEDRKGSSLMKKDQDEALQMFIDPNNGRKIDVAMEKKEVDYSVQNFSPLESLKQRIKANGIISRFY